MTTWLEKARSGPPSRDQDDQRHCSDAAVEQGGRRSPRLLLQPSPNGFPLGNRLGRLEPDAGNCPCGNGGAPSPGTAGHKGQAHQAVSARETGSFAEDPDAEWIGTRSLV
jgi:hypothetical protein